MDFSELHRRRIEEQRQWVYQQLMGELAKESELILTVPPIQPLQSGESYQLLPDESDLP